MSAITMTAAVASQPGADFSLETVELDAPRADEILVKIAGVGICHTDLSARDHRMMLLPAVLGHEGSGTVERVGSAVTKVAPGDAVALSFRSCGECRNCRVGEPSYCLNFMMLNFGGGRPDGSKAITRGGGEALSSNFFGQSSFATYALAYESNVVKLPPDLPVELMGPLGCGIQTGAGGILRSLNCAHGSSLVVLGGGSVGLSAVMAGRIRGCNPLVVVEPHASRRALALELGATHAIDPKAVPDLTEALRAISPAGFDSAFDTSGLAKVIEATVAALAVRGQIGIVGGPPTPDGTITLPIIGIMSAGITVRGIVEGDSDPDTFIPELIAHYRAGRFPFDRLIRTYQFDQINQAIHDQHAGTVIKAVLVTG